MWYEVTDGNIEKRTLIGIVFANSKEEAIAKYNKDEDLCPTYIFATELNENKIYEYEEQKY